jgi:hypothetical protein
MGICLWRETIAYLTLNRAKSLHLHPVIKSLARMAELVDASDSKSGIGNDVQVRFLFRALFPIVNNVDCKFY